MNGRYQTEEREHLTRDEKRSLLIKSNNRCAHCGIPLTSSSPDTTTEHIIPLSKGGTNDIENLAILCKNCNAAKNDLIVSPREYFKYLKEEYLAEAIENHEEYCSRVKWFTTKNYLPEDIMKLTYQSYLPNTQGYRKKKNKNGICYVQQNMTAVLKKANVEDLSEIIEFVTKYHKKFNLDTSDLKRIIESTFMKGTIYTISNKAGIIAVLPVAIEKEPFQSREGYIMRFYGIPCLYQRKEYFTLIKNALRYMIDGIAALSGSNCILVDITYPKNDEFAGHIAKSEYAWISDQEDGWMVSKWCICTDPSLDSKKIFESIEFVTKKFEENSLFLQRYLGLKEIKDEKDLTKIKEIKKIKSRKTVEEIDEYDPRFYGIC